MYPVLKFSACLSVCVRETERERETKWEEQREKNSFFPYCLEQLNYSEIIYPLQDW